jgi:hypothetical protein
VKRFQFAGTGFSYTSPNSDEPEEEQSDTTPSYCAVPDAAGPSLWVGSVACVLKNFYDYVLVEWQYPYTLLIVTLFCQRGSFERIRV